MPLINITRKPSTLQGYQLATPADMTATLVYLSTRGYIGSISDFRSGGNIAWSMTLQLESGAGNVMTGTINDWVVIENDAIATIVPAAKATAMYQPA